MIRNDCSEPLTVNFTVYCCFETGDAGGPMAPASAEDMPQVRWEIVEAASE